MLGGIGVCTVELAAQLPWCFLRLLDKLQHHKRATHCYRYTLRAQPQHVCLNASLAP